MNKLIEDIKKIDSECTLITHAAAVLGWDQETYMPEEALDERSEQLAYLEGLAHEKFTSPELGKLLKAAACTDENPFGDKSFSETERAYLRAIYRAYSKSTKLPLDFVTEKARLVSQSQAVWAEARKNNDFKSFEPYLQKMVDMAKKEATFFGFEKNPYDGLLDQYEAGLTQAELERVFGGLQKKLVEIVEKIKTKNQVSDSFLHIHCPESKQAAFSTFIMQEIGYDLKKGRLDKTAHPFSTTLGINDSRITTRYLEEYFPSSVFSTMHESGHALYELGINREYALTSLGEACSMAIHESQSRTWENMVGRSYGFWQHYYKDLQLYLSPNLDSVSLDSFYAGINKVEPSFIRTEADEVTYSLHVILRFNIENRLMDGSLLVKDVPEAWNKELKDLLGIVPKNDAEGCLQDIHWSMGAIGYFPSYALGNLYGAQFFAKMKKDLNHVEVDISNGKTKTVLDWLRANIHTWGSYYTPGELVKKVTGEDLNPEYFVEYLKTKYSKIYGF